MCLLVNFKHRPKQAITSHLANFPHTAIHRECSTNMLKFWSRLSAGASFFSTAKPHIPTMRRCIVSLVCRTLLHHNKALICNGPAFIGQNTGIGWNFAFVLAQFAACQWPSRPINFSCAFNPQTLLGKPFRSSSSAKCLKRGRARLPVR